MTNHVHNHWPQNVFARLNFARLANEDARRFGFYSPTQAQNGIAIWRTPEGAKVIVTAVYGREGVPMFSGYSRDSRSVGEVVECIDVIPRGLDVAS